MPAHTKEIVDQFCILCDELISTWQMRKFLFDDNPNVGSLRTPRHEHFFKCLQDVLQESWLHRLAKLHDPAVQGGAKSHINLSLDYIITYGQWDPHTRATLTALMSQMEALAKPIKDARNKLLSHNDLAVLLASKELGSFDPGEDVMYFIKLREFASLISQAVLGQQYSYHDLIKNDVVIFMNDFLHGMPNQPMLLTALRSAADRQGVRRRTQSS